MIDPTAIEAVLAIFLPLIHAHRQTSPAPPPFMLGLSGLQGSGKSTWASALSAALTDQHGLRTRIVSLDDLYSDHADLVVLRQANPENGLLQSRGQPGTHDEVLAREFFSQVRGINEPKDEDAFVSWPAYDKSLNSGQGGRVPVEEWEKVPVSEGLDVLIFEGWCLGFQPLTDKQVEQKWEADKAATETGSLPSDEAKRTQTLASHALDHLLLINRNLARYCSTFTGPACFDGFLHLSTEDLANVYEWRLGQEHALRRSKPGMTDEQVVRFVRGYMAAYELFLDRLQRENFFGDGDEPRGTHVQVVLDRGREVIRVKVVE